MIGVFIFNSSKSHTQEIYQTKHGLCLIKTEYKNEDIIFHSFSSSVSFQPNTAKLELILPIESLYNGNKYIETMLAKLEKGEFRLTGRLNLNEDKITLSWRRPTFPPGMAVSSALAGLTSLFGMGRGGPCRCNHPKILKT